MAHSIGRLNVAICGGGAVAHVLAAVCSNESSSVRILTRRPDSWAKNIRLDYLSDWTLRSGQVIASDAPGDIIPGSDIVFFALPTCALRDVLTAIAPYVQPSMWIGVISGNNGFDWLCQAHLPAHERIFGFQRCPYVCRVVRYGAHVHLTGIRPIGVLAAAHSGTDSLQTPIRKLLNLRTVIAPNFLNIHLTQGNALLHSARLWSALRHWSPGQSYKGKLLFYEEWNDAASKVYWAFDEELQEI